MMTPDGASESKTSDRDLVITRVISAPRAMLWKAWTEAEHLAQWWAPKPWTAEVTELDVRAGGAFCTVMRGPEGEEFGGDGVFLEVVEGERIVFTDALEPGYRPGPNPFMTVIITMKDLPDGGSEYTARVLHKSEEDKKKHEEMGFFQGWNTCIDQLAALVEDLAEEG